MNSFPVILPLGFLSATLWSWRGRLAAALLVPGSASLWAAADQPQAEVLAAAGVAGIFDPQRTLQTRLEYHFRDPLFWHLRPYLSAGVAADNAYHVGAGLACRWQLNRNWRLLAGSGPALYRRHGGYDLGHRLEFFSHIELDRRLARGQWLGLRLAHVSNAGLGATNPGREMLGLTYSRAWGRPKGGG